MVYFGNLTHLIWSYQYPNKRFNPSMWYFTYKITYFGFYKSLGRYLFKFGNLLIFDVVFSKIGLNQF